MLCVHVSMSALRALVKGFVLPSKKTYYTEKFLKHSICFNETLFKASKENKNHQKGGEMSLLPYLKLLKERKSEKCA